MSLPAATAPDHRADDARLLRSIAADYERAVDPIPMRGHQGLRDITDPAILKRLAA